MRETKPRIIHTHQQHAMEVEMVGQARWAEIRRLHEEEGQSISAIARCMELDRKTVRRCLSTRAWQPYLRRAKVDKLLTGHADWLHQRVPRVRYSARILY